MNPSGAAKPNYGVDAPGVLRNLFLFGAIGILLGLFGPLQLHIGPVVFILRPMFLGIGIVLLIETSLFLFYVKREKLWHRDRQLALNAWRGDEQVLDVGCGRGLLLAGAAKRVPRGAATGMDLWSSGDLSGNTEQTTWRNLGIEGVADRCRVVSATAQDMPFPDASFDVVVSNLCLHNIKDTALRRQAVRQIVRVLRPGGVALISDYKLTGEYQAQLRGAGLEARRIWSSWMSTFPPLRIVVARKPAL